MIVDILADDPFNIPGFAPGSRQSSKPGMCLSHPEMPPSSCMGNSMKPRYSPP
jgi:hypothetical protein